MKIAEIANNLQTVEQQKKRAKKLLTEISENFEYALVAGGAPRNWAYNRSANDLDIYVCRKKGKLQKDIDSKIDAGVKKMGDKYGFNSENNKAVDVVNSNAYGGFILNALYDFSIFDDEEKQNCQLIIIDDTADMVKDLKTFSQRIFMTYDFGICMTSMDKDGNFYNDEMFETDIKNKTFTVNVRELRRNNNAGLQKLVERFEKMEKYFPDHKMRIVA